MGINIPRNMEPALSPHCSCVSLCVIPQDEDEKGELPEEEIEEVEEIQELISETTPSLGGAEEFPLDLQEVWDTVYSGVWSGLSLLILIAVLAVIFLRVRKPGRKHR